ncbi:HU family DNA-binding protein [Deinococcus peraridilitoris]|uniref:Bacterial nucleoid DNA-binding protein n=1 Tax=Deinococcus peraridilitoris (strain DSM 19664 / LMG 22246 / CIP 109416 / KR-200) TaxID=937777 RepID=L0A3I0_DEIPD|nr:HU family DNA-binding protein [Deinococcus peraridilitoris]AFZ67732.1 bacterial nucleoid DNA-binding protein [Deinococcus peraridilitoris DSM 19664]
MTKSSKAKTSKAAPKAAAAPAAPAKAESTKLGKTHIVEAIADKAGLSKKQAAEVFDAFGDIVVDALKGGKSVGLPGLGTFSVTSTAERQGVRPGTSERITIPAGKKVRFKIASNLKGNL